MSETDFKQIDAYRYACPGCGGSLRYDIAGRDMLCDACGQRTPVSSLPDAMPAAGENGEAMLDMVEYVCPSCGAGIHATGTAATSFCCYCGADVVLTQRLSRIRRPDRIVPFRITREECESIYRRRLKEARFAPDALSEPATVDRFRPIYIPYWNYTYTASGESHGRGVRKYSDSDYNYEDDYSFDLSGEVKLTQLLYDASSAFEDETAQKLQFGIQAACPFHPAYLSGMYAEAADTSDAVYRDALQGIAEHAFNDAMQGKTGTTGSFSLPPERSAEAELVMMPVWLLANRQGDRVLYTAVNGDSGRIVCEPPVSKKRFALLSAALFCGLLAALLLITQVLVLRPNMLLMFCGIMAAFGLRQIVPIADDILVRRLRDIDPTRDMKRFAKDYDRSIPGIERMEFPGGGFDWGRLRGIGCSAGVLLMMLLPMISGLGWSRIQSLLISDRAILPPAVLIIAGIILFTLEYTYPATTRDEGRPEAGFIDLLMLYVMRALVVGGILVTIFPVPAVGLWCYGLSIAIMALLAANMLRLNLLHTEFVTRPIPFFGKEAEQ